MIIALKAIKSEFMKKYILIFFGLLYCLMGMSLAITSILYVTRKVNDYNYVTIPRRLPDLLLNTIPEHSKSFEVNYNC